MTAAEAAAEAEAGAGAEGPDLEAALAAAWVAPGGGSAGKPGPDFRPVLRALAREPWRAAEADARGRTALHAAAVLPAGPGRRRLLTTLLGLGADPAARDAEGWAPGDSADVAAAAEAWAAWRARYRQPHPDLALLLEGTAALAGSSDGDGEERRRQVAEALWLGVTRHNVLRTFDVPALGGPQQPLHLVCRLLAGRGAGPAAPDPEPLRPPDPRLPEVAARRQKWGARAKLQRLRRAALEAAGTVAVEPWSQLHELLALVLDLGGDQEARDAGGRLPRDLVAAGGASPTAAALLASDWELGDRTKGARVLTEEGDVVDTRTGLVVEERAVLKTGDAEADAAALGAALERLDITCSAKEAEDESFYARRGRAEAELRVWRRRNGQALKRAIARWPERDAVAQAERWGRCADRGLGGVLFPERDAEAEEAVEEEKVKEVVKEAEAEAEEETEAAGGKFVFERGMEYEFEFEYS